MRLNAFAVCCCLSIVGVNAPGLAAQKFITLASTTSTENSGLLGKILPEFTDGFGVQVRVVAVGTGQAVRLASNGDADVLLVHHLATEERFVADGFGVNRRAVMHNDFVLVGSHHDPADIGQTRNAGEALERIAETKSLFVSRGDNSGTHMSELALWQSIEIDPTGASGRWYREMGAGMGATLNAAVAMGAYTLVDRATWSSFSNKTSFKIYVERDPALNNQYTVILVNPERHPHVKEKLGRIFIEWLLSPAGQSAIAAFTIDGEQVFFPNSD